ncbi:MAG: hypothetical protein QOH12_2810 [Solirubrobacteraceae bacterium]|jgi:hypothetical protein|nr:hypothetical protein [Solirubrobacteraceae bacterium]
MFGLTSQRPAGPRRRRAKHFLLVTCVALAASLLGAAGAWAAPANDGFAAAAPVAGVPFTDTVDASTATTEPGEPQSCAFANQTVWYSFTPSVDETLAADTNGSGGPGQITAYRADGAGLGGLSFLACANFGPQRAAFAVQAGRTYYLQASLPFGGPGTLRVNLAAVAPPSNDDFAGATAIGSTPFSGSTDLTAATVQPGEPAGCQGGAAAATGWYAFTPGQAGSYVARRSDFGTIAAYTGTGVSSLTQVACASGQLYFHADAGTTYYLQIAGPSFQGGPVQLTLDAAPVAVASFFFSPSDPSVLDTVQFFDTSFDPAGIASETWRFPGGLTASGCCPTHRYPADGDYPTQLAITTTDGRSASTSQVVHVKTHDVAITQLVAPSSVRVGRTRQIAVAVNNSRYAETVQVAILRSTPGGSFVQVGQVTQGVPARAARRTTTFSISYTFAPEDATIGKVTFEAVATILTARDSDPADNTAIAPPTRVTA